MPICAESTGVKHQPTNPTKFAPLVQIYSSPLYISECTTLKILSCFND